MEKHLFFDEPKQVKFIDVDYDDGVNQEPHWLGGIAYQDRIICGCCGGVISLKDLYDDWEEFAKDEWPMVESPLVVYEYWVDIEESLRD